MAQTLAFLGFLQLLFNIMGIMRTRMNDPGLPLWGFFGAFLVYKPHHPFLFLNTDSILSPHSGGVKKQSESRTFSRI